MRSLNRERRERPLRRLSRLLGGALVASFAAVSLACGGDESISKAEDPATAAEEPRDSSFSAARVVNVTDAITIEVEAGGQVYGVRYLGVDLPTGDGASAAARALEFNRFMVAGKTVELERGPLDTDAYGLLLRYVYVDGVMVNRALLANGHASVATSPAEFKHRRTFEIEEEAARREQLGFWAAAAPEEAEEQETPFSGGTLPQRPDADSLCDYSGSMRPVIKGNVDARTGERVYHVPGGLFYSTTVISMDEGDSWLCTEEGALAAGWDRSAH